MKNTNKFIYILIIFILCFTVGIVAVKLFYKNDSSVSDNKESVYTEDIDDEINDGINDEISDEQEKNPTRPENNPIGTEKEDFYLMIDSVFTITGTGTVIYGKILRGTVSVGDMVQTVGVGKESKTDVVKEITIERKDVESAKVGDEVALVLSKINEKDVIRGQILAKPNSVKSHKKFVASIYVYTSEEIGHRAYSISNGNKQEFYFRNKDYSGKLEFQGNFETLNPGQKSKAIILLDTDCVMEVGTEFFIRFGGYSLGYGKVTEVY